MKTQTIGVEIEMTGITRCKAAGVIAKYFGGVKTYAGGCYNTYEATDRQGRIWKAMSDSSIVAQKKVGGSIISASNEYRTEIVTPILKYDDIEDLQEVIRLLRKAGALVNTSCGIHIHIGANDMSVKGITNLVKMVNAHEDLIHESLAIDPHRAYRWCKKTDTEFLEKLENEKPQTMTDLRYVWYSQAPNENMNQHYNSTRYHGLNLHALFTKGTVEFRLFNSTLHAGKIKAYIQFCLAMVAKARVAKRASSKKVVTDNLLYSFRCWFIELGLKGEEFKTCRLHMMSNLEGNSSYRHGA